MWLSKWIPQQQNCDPEALRSVLRVELDRGFISIDSPVPSSSRGPTHDLRVKPDVMAPGYDLITAHSNGGKGPPHCSPDPNDPDRGEHRLPLRIPCGSC